MCVTHVSLHYQLQRYVFLASTTNWRNLSKRMVNDTHQEWTSADWGYHLQAISTATGSIRNEASSSAFPRASPYRYCLSFSSITEITRSIQWWTYHNIMQSIKWASESTTTGDRNNRKECADSTNNRRKKSDSLKAIITASFIIAPRHKDLLPSDKLSITVLNNNDYVA